MTTSSCPNSFPSFLVIGATRSGSTTLNHVLGSHPDVFVPFNRELHYFDRNDRFNTQLDGYLELFEGYNGERIIGEVTPNYWKRRIKNKSERDGYIYPMRRIADCLPGVKLIVSLRDPMTRLRSLYMKDFLQGRRHHSLDELVRLEASGKPEVGYVFGCKYNKNLKHILDIFPAKNLKIVIFEEWTQNQESAMQNIFSFIGADVSQQVVPVATNGWGRYRIEGDDRVPEVELSSEMKEYVLETTSESRVWLENFLGRELPWVAN